MPLAFRLIRQADDAPLAHIAQKTVIEFGRSDSEYLKRPETLENLYSYYQQPGSSYHVIYDTATDGVVGGGGYAPLESHPHICELQKFFFLPQARGRGMGRKLLERLITEAAACGYQEMYLEAVPEMASAIRFYERMGFLRITERLKTNHTCCTVYMKRNMLDSIPCSPTAFTAQL